MAYTTPATPKFRRWLKAILLVAVGLLPELLPDEYKTYFKNLLGTHYALVWTITFLAISAVIFYLESRESQAEGSGSVTRNSVKIEGHQNKVRQGAGPNSSINEGTIIGDGNEIQQG